MEKQFEEMEMLERIFYMQNLFDSDLIKNRNLEFSKEVGRVVHRSVHRIGCQDRELPVDA